MHPRDRRRPALTAPRRAVRRRAAGAAALPAPSRSLAQALGVGRFGVWAFVGAGGKTAAIRRLLGERPDAVATTTTHLDGAGFDIGLLAVAPDAANLEAMEAALGALGPATFALGGKRGRLQAPSADWLQRFFLRHRDGLVLVEADGARRRLVKLPGPHEPAWPPVVLSGNVVVVGCDALDERLEQAAHRPAAFGAGGARVTAAHLEAMLAAYVERALPAPICILLTGVDAARLPIARRLSAFAARAVQGRARRERRRPQPLRIVATPDLASGAYWVLAASRRTAPATPFDTVWGVLLAAGRGARFGSVAGATKLLVRWRGRALVEHAVEAWSAAGFGRLCVVTGEARAAVEAEVRRAARRRPLALVHNPDHARGLGTSVRRAARAAPAGVALLYGHADMPALRPETLRRIAAAGVALGDRIVVPTVGGAPRNPAYFPADLRTDLARAAGERGGKQVQALHPDRVFLLPMDDVASEFVDIDRPTDLRHLRHRRLSRKRR